MATGGVSRCVAVAAHGRRCQQTPYRGGPYCWHHTQSRKVWAPSRTGRNGHARATAPAGGESESATLEARLEAAARLVRALQPSELAMLLHFVEEVEGGNLTMSKANGDLERLEVTKPAARRSRAAAAGVEEPV